jgi:hypothetical protein
MRPVTLRLAITADQPELERLAAELCVLLRCYGCAAPPSVERRRNGLLEPRARLAPA